MKITDALYGEHGPLYALLAHCESSAPQWELAEDVHGVFSFRLRRELYGPARARSLRLRKDREIPHP